MESSSKTKREPWVEGHCLFIKQNTQWRNWKKNYLDKDPVGIDLTTREILNIVADLMSYPVIAPSSIKKEIRKRLNEKYTGEELEEKLELLENRPIKRIVDSVNATLRILKIDDAQFIKKEDNGHYKPEIYSIQSPAIKNDDERIWFGSNKDSKKLLKYKIIQEKNTETILEDLLNKGIIAAAPVNELSKLAKVFQALYFRDSSMSKKVLTPKEEKFIEIRRNQTLFRGVLSRIAAKYYQNKGVNLLSEQIPIIYKKDWIPDRPIELRSINLEYSHDQFDFRNSLFNNYELLPTPDRYSENLNHYLEGIKLEDNFAYRLKSIKKTNGNYSIECAPATYFDYIDTCEFLSYEFSNEVFEKSEKVHQENIDISKLHPKMRDQIDIFDFDNRSLVIGINTILIISTKKGNFFFMHKRSKKNLAEAMNTYHVVPAGTFQPRHKEDGLHDMEFDMYKNIMREFGEELLGQQEFQTLATDLEDVIDIDPVSFYHSLIESGKGHAYFLGMGLDCLTTKPEFFTALVFKDLDVKRVKFKDNFEGEHFPVSLTEERMNYYMEYEKTLPAGAACIWLVNENMDFFLDQL